MQTMLEKGHSTSSVSSCSLMNALLNTDISVDSFNDACYQALAYWIMSAITNDPFRLARFAGIYHAIQSAGGAGSFGMDAVATPYMNELVGLWISTVSMPCQQYP
jgi:hypothetical protein